MQNMSTGDLVNRVRQQEEEKKRSLQNAKNYMASMNDISVPTSAPYDSQLILNHPHADLNNRYTDFRPMDVYYTPQSKSSSSSNLCDVQNGDDDPVVKLALKRKREDHNIIRTNPSNSAFQTRSHMVYISSKDRLVSKYPSSALFEVAKRHPNAFHNSRLAKISLATLNFPDTIFHINSNNDTLYISEVPIHISGVVPSRMLYFFRMPHGQYNSIQALINACNLKSRNWHFVTYKDLDISIGTNLLGKLTFSFGFDEKKMRVVLHAVVDKPTVKYCINCPPIQPNIKDLTRDNLLSTKQLYASDIFAPRVNISDSSGNYITFNVADGCKHNLVAHDIIVDGSVYYSGSTKLCKIVDKYLYFYPHDDVQYSNNTITLKIPNVKQAIQ